MNNFLEPFLNLFKTVQSLPAQVKATASMPNSQAQAYRQQVNQTVPKVPTSPQFTTNPYAMIAAQTVNALPNSVSGLAKLPAARTPGQFASDAWNIAQAPLAVAGLTRNAPQSQISSQIPTGNGTTMASQSDPVALAYEKALNAPSPDWNLLERFRLANPGDQRFAVHMMTNLASNVPKFVQAAPGIFRAIKP